MNQLLAHCRLKIILLRLVYFFLVLLRAKIDSLYYILRKKQPSNPRTYTYARKIYDQCPKMVDGSNAVCCWRKSIYLVYILHLNLSTPAK